MSDRCIGVIGLGNMGRGMCQSLLREGFEVYGADLGAQQCELAREMGVKVVASLQELCEATKTILLSLPAAKHVQQVVLGESGLINTARPDTLIIDTSTSEPDVTRALAQQLSDSGLAMLDAPVSGGPAGAAAGTMVMVVGGSELSLARAMPFFEALSSKVVHLGDSGSGHAAKLINNLLCAAHLVTTAEALALGESAGLDAAKLLEGLNAGSGRSAVSEVNFPRWILSDTFDSGFTMQLMRKDVGLARALIAQSDLSLPLSELVAERWRESVETLADGEDFNAIVRTVSGGAQ